MSYLSNAQIVPGIETPASASHWSGNSPAEIWMVYAKVVKGMDAAARRMVDHAIARALAARAGA
jgi:hypothetical protein